MEKVQGLRGALRAGRGGGAIAAIPRYDANAAAHVLAGRPPQRGAAVRPASSAAGVLCGRRADRARGASALRARRERQAAARTPHHHPCRHRRAAGPRANRRGRAHTQSRGRTAGAVARPPR
eukprot:4193687-Prymnesium_polylepis.1